MIENIVLSFAEDELLDYNLRADDSALLLYYCSDKIKTKHTILINDIDDRIESIKAALDYIGDKKYIIAKELLVLQDDESMSDLWGHNKKSVEIYKNAYKKWMI